MKFTHVLMAFAASTALLTTACDEDDPIVEENEEELITTVNMVVTGGDPQETRAFTFRDLDGDGGDDGVVTVTGDALEATTTYTYALTFLNESETPPEDITAEIREEDEEHQVFFSSNGVDLIFAPTDEDEDDNPIGLVGTLTTGEAGTGKMTVTLRHEPNKDAEGVSEGDITNASGDTDIMVEFDVEVE